MTVGLAGNIQRTAGALIVIATVSAVAATGCDSSPPGAPEVTLCDGSEGLTLRIFLASQIDREVTGSAVRVENGHPSFAVDGKCQYFMSGGWIEDRQSRDLPWRRGSVDDALRSFLEDEVGFADLTRIYKCADRVFDSAPGVVANTRSAIACRGGGERLLALFSNMRQRAGDLWRWGTLLEGDLHIILREPSGAEPERKYAWPSELAFREYYEPDLNVPSKAVAAADAAPLRAIRDQYLRDTQPGVLYLGAGIPVSDGETSAMMFVRDALPYEDESGLWPLPGQ